MIGALRHTLWLEAETRVDDGHGGFTATWTPIAGLRAKVEAISAEEGSAADRTLASVTHRITLRHRAGVLPARRFTLDDRVFLIQGVRDPNGRGRFLVCDCREEIAG